MLKIFRQKILVIFFGLAFGLLFFSLGLIFLNLSQFSEPLILHFDSFRGADFSGSKTDFFGIWLVGFAFAVANTILSEVFFYRERILSYIFCGANFIISILVLIFVAVVLRVNL